MLLCDIVLLKVSVPRRNMEVKSLHIIGSKESGGAEKFFLRLTQALVSAGQACEIIIPKKCSFAHLIDPRIPVLTLSMSSIFDFYSRFKIRNIVKAHKPQIVQTYMGRATRLTHLPRALGVSHIARLGGYYNVKGYRHAHAWVANTQGIADYLQTEGLPKKNIFQIGNFVPVAPRVPDDMLTKLRADLSIPTQAQLVLAVGRLHPNKAFDTLLYAFAKMVRQQPDRLFRLIVLGDGPDKAALAQLTQQLHLGELVHWAGWQQDPNPYYQMANLFVCPSRHEPLGNVILEAWSNRCPVVSTQSQGAMELVETGTEAKLVAIDDIDGLANAMLSTLLDPEQRSHLTDAGWQRLAQKHSEQSVVGAYLQLYQQLLESR